MQTKASDSQPLNDITILDLTNGIAGPYCTKMLADYGAKIIKIEHPLSGDFSRKIGPFPGNISNQEKSGTFLLLNNNKRSVGLNLKSSEGKSIIHKLIAKSDVIIESFSPGVMERLELDYSTLSKSYPKLIMTSISNFGQTGPYANYKASELVFFGMGGRMHSSGLPERNSVKLGGNHVQYQAGNMAAMATMFAFYGLRYQKNLGQHVDISIFESQMGSMNARISQLGAYQYNGEKSSRAVYGAGGFPSGFYECKDGFINIQGTGSFWPRVTEMLGSPDLKDNPLFAPPLGQLNPESKEEFLSSIWNPWLSTRTKNEVVEECQKFGIPTGSVNNVKEVMNNNPQFAYRGYFGTIDHPVAGSFKYPGPHFVTEQNWWKIRNHAPTLGQHTNEVLNELGYSPSTIFELAQKGVISSISKEN